MSNTGWIKFYQVHLLCAYDNSTGVSKILDQYFVAAKMSHTKITIDVVCLEKFHCAVESDEAKQMKLINHSWEMFQYVKISLLTLLV